MRFLRVGGLGFIDAGFFGQIFSAEILDNNVACFGHRFRCNLCAVGPHISDEAGLFAVNRHTLIKQLRHLHGALGVKAQLAAGFLLQGRGGERRGGLALAGFTLNRLNREVSAGNRGFGFARHIFVAEGKFFDFFALMRHQPCRQHVAISGFKVGID